MPEAQALHADACRRHIPPGVVSTDGERQPNMADDQENAPLDEDAKGLRKLLNEANARATAAEAKALEIEQKTTRDTAFAKAGIPDSPLGEMFRDGYKGDLTPDAIKARALELGLVQQERATPDAEREQLLSLQSDQAPGQRPADKSLIADLTKQIAGMDDNEAIFDLLREHGLTVG